MGDSPREKKEALKVAVGRMLNKESRGVSFKEQEAPAKDALGRLVKQGSSGVGFSSRAGGGGGGSATGRSTKHAKFAFLGLLRRSRSLTADEEQDVVQAVFRSVGITRDQGATLMRALGIRDRSDLAFVRSISAEFLLSRVERDDGCGMSPVEALRLCKKLQLMPNVGVKDVAGLRETLTNFGAVDLSVPNPSNKLLMAVNAKELFVPTYPALVVKRLRNLDEIHKTMTFMFKIALRFDFHDLPTQLCAMLLERISLRVNDVTVKVADIDHSTTPIDAKRSVWMLALRLSLDSTPFTGAETSAKSLYAHFSDYPFDRPKVYICIEVLPFALSTEDILAAVDEEIAALEVWKVRFNLHRFVRYSSNEFAHLPVEASRELNKNVQLKVREHANKLPNFQILHNLTTVTFPLDGSKRHSTPSVVYSVPLVRHPGAALRSMVLPLLALNLGTLLTLFMNDVGDNFNDRLANGITLMVALFAFLGYARSAMPDVPTSTWIDRAILRSTLMCMAVMLESLFAFLTSKGASGRRAGGGDEGASKNAKGGAFHYFWDFRPTFRAILRCFGFGLPLIAVQLSTMTALYQSFRRYRHVLRLNDAVLEFFRRSEKIVGGNERFSRRHYVHPSLCDADQEDVARSLMDQVNKSQTHLEGVSEKNPSMARIPSALGGAFFDSGISKSKRGSLKKKTHRVRLGQHPNRAARKVAVLNSHVNTWKSFLRDEDSDDDRSETSSLASCESAWSAASGRSYGIFSRLRRIGTDPTLATHLENAADDLDCSRAPSCATSNPSPAPSVDSAINSPSLTPTNLTPTNLSDADECHTPVSLLGLNDDAAPSGRDDQGNVPAPKYRRRRIFRWSLEQHANETDADDC